MSCGPLLDPGALFFVDRFYVGGERTNLDTLEQSTLDKTGRDPRLHFGFNCMSYSCPPLRNEPFEGDKLAQQLRDQGEVYLSDSRAAVRRNDQTVELNSIFTSFYRKDFERGVEGDGDMKLINSLLRFARDDSPIVGATDGTAWATSGSSTARRSEANLIAWAGAATGGWWTAAVVANNLTAEAITFDDVLLIPRRSDFVPGDAT